MCETLDCVKESCNDVFDLAVHVSSYNSSYQTNSYTQFEPVDVHRAAGVRSDAQESGHIGFGCDSEHGNTMADSNHIAIGQGVAIDSAIHDRF